LTATGILSPYQIKQKRALPEQRADNSREQGKAYQEFAKRATADFNDELTF
jgi:hypothetical protein